LKNYDRALAGTIKFHKICHWPAFIQEFGAPTNYNAETFETAHKWFVKRWIGCLPHGNAKSMMSLMRRNNIFLSHGGSSLLSNQRKTTRAKKTFEVVSDQGGGSFLKLFLPGENAWVHAGMFVLYNGGTKGGDVARLVAFRRGSRLGAVLVTVRKCRCVETSSVLSTHTQAWCLQNDPGALLTWSSILNQTSASNCIQCNATSQMLTAFIRVRTCAPFNWRIKFVTYFLSGSKTNSYLESFLKDSNFVVESF